MTNCIVSLSLNLLQWCKSYLIWSLTSYCRFGWESSMLLRSKKWWSRYLCCYWSHLGRSYWRSSHWSHFRCCCRWIGRKGLTIANITNFIIRLITWCNIIAIRNTRSNPRSVSITTCFAAQWPFSPGGILWRTLKDNFNLLANLKDTFCRKSDNREHRITK